VSPRRPRCRPSPPALLAAAVLAAAWTVARGADDVWNGKATVGYAGTSAPSGSTNALRQTYEGLLRLEASSALEGQLRLRYDDTREGNEAAGVTTRSTSQTLQPRALIQYRLAPFDLSAGYDVAFSRGASSRYDAVSHTLADRLHLTAGVTPESLPSAHLMLSRQTNRSAGSDGEVRNTTGQLSLAHSVAAVHMTQSTLATWKTDTRSHVQSRTIQPGGSVSFDTKLAGIGFSGAYNVSYNDTAQTSLSGRAEVALVERSARTGLWGVTNNPSDTSGGALDTSSRLVDGNHESPVPGIFLGADASLNQNIGIDIGRLVVLDTLRLWVRNADGSQIQNLAATAWTWNVYSSNDGNFWTLLPAPQPAIDDTLGLFQWSFPVPTTARYFKVVYVSGPPTTEAFVTELEGLAKELVDPRAVTRSTGLVQGVTASATASPFSKLALSTQGSVNRSSQSSPRSTFDSRGWSVGGNATAGPFDDNRLTVTVGHELRGSATSVGDSRLGWQSSATTQYRVLDPVSLSAEAHRSMEEGATDRMDAMGGRVSGSATLLPSTLDLAAMVGFDRVLTQPDNVETDRVSASVSSAARILPSLSLSAAASVQTGEVRQPASAVVLFPQPPASRVYSGTAMYRPHERLTLGASLAYMELSHASGLTQQYRVSWNPFPGGSFRLGLTYDQSLDAMTGNRVSRFMILPRWQLNPHASLDGSYSDTVQTAPAPRTHTHVFFVGLTVRT
jgi:hypothetical protein